MAAASVDRAFSALAYGLRFIGRELATNAALHWRDVAPLCGVWVALHVVFETVIPACVPGVYDVFNTKLVQAGRPPVSRRALAADMRTRIVSVLFSLYVCYHVLAATLTGDGYIDATASFDASTPLSNHLVRVAVSVSERGYRGGVGGGHGGGGGGGSAARHWPAHAFPLPLRGAAATGTASP